MNLVRTQRGRMVHRADCPQILRGAVGAVTPWEWADGRSREEVAAMIAQIDAKTCGHCTPLVWLE